MRWENVEVSRDRIDLSTLTPARSMSPSTGDQRPLQRLVDGRHALGREARLQHHPQPQRHVGVLGGVLASPCRAAPGRRSCPTSWRRARARSTCVEGDAGVPQVALGQRVHAVLAAAAVERIGEQHGVVERRRASMPCRRSTRQSYLRFCPILRTDGVLQQRLAARPAPRLSGTCCRSPSPKSKRRCRRDARAARSRPCRAPRPARSRRTRPAWHRGWSSRCRRRSGRRRGPRRSRPRAAAARSPSRTWSGRSWPWRALAASATAACGVAPDGAVAGLPPGFGGGGGRPARRHRLTVEPTDRSTGGGASAPSPSAMRLVSVANSISRRKPSSAVGLGVAHAQLLHRHGRRARPA